MDQLNVLKERLRNVQVSTKNVVFISVAVFLLLSVSIIYYFFSQDARRKEIVNQPQVTLPAEVAPPTGLRDPLTKPPTAPITRLSLMVASCKFNFFQSCVSPVEGSSAAEEKKTKYEDFVQEDIISIFTKGKTADRFLETKVELTPEQYQRYFADYLASGKPQAPVMASVVLERIAKTENVHPRILLSLIEILRQKQGIVLYPLADVDHVYYDDNPGFANQLIAAAQELKGYQVQYDLMQQETGHLPTELNFFGKTYTVDKDMNPESLALIEFFSKHLPQVLFEKAVVVLPDDADPNKAQIAPTENFVMIYKFYFIANSREE